MDKIMTFFIGLYLIFFTPHWICGLLVWACLKD